MRETKTWGRKAFALLLMVVMALTMVPLTAVSAFAAITDIVITDGLPTYGADVGMFDPKPDGNDFIIKKTAIMDMGGYLVETGKFKDISQLSHMRRSARTLKNQ